MAAVKQYHKLFGATSAYKRQLLVKIHVKSHRAPFKSKPPPAGRRFCFGQITPDNTVPARSTDYCTSRSHRRAARCVDYLPLIEHRYPITEAAGEIAL